MAKNKKKTCIHNVILATSKDRGKCMNKDCGKDVSLVTRK